MRTEYGFDLERLLRDICNFYNYEVVIRDNGYVVCDGGAEGYVFPYSSINKALKGFLNTMLESNKTNEIEGLGKYYTWSEECINIIQNL